MNFFIIRLFSFIWDKVFKSEPSKTCGRQTAFKKFEDRIPSNFVKGVYQKLCLVHS